MGTLDGAPAARSLPDPSIANGGSAAVDVTSRRDHVELLTSFCPMPKTAAARGDRNRFVRRIPCPVHPVGHFSCRNLAYLVTQPSCLPPRPGYAFRSLHCPFAISTRRRTLLTQHWSPGPAGFSAMLVHRRGGQFCCGPHCDVPPVATWAGPCFALGVGVPVRHPPRGPPTHTASPQGAPKAQLFDSSRRLSPAWRWHC